MFKPIVKLERAAVVLRLDIKMSDHLAILCGLEDIDEGTLISSEKIRERLEGISVDDGSFLAYERSFLLELLKVPLGDLNLKVMTSKVEIYYRFLQLVMLFNDAGLLGFLSRDEFSVYWDYNLIPSDLLLFLYLKGKYENTSTEKYKGVLPMVGVTPMGFPGIYSDESFLGMLEMDIDINIESYEYKLEDEEGTIEGSMLK